MERALHTLPEGYREIFKVDLAKDKKIFWLVNGLSLLIGLIMAILGHFVVPITELFSMEQGFGDYCLRFLVLMVGTVAYIILHELVHGIAMKLCGTKKVRYGYKVIYAYAGSDDYYRKNSYLFIALAPVVLWGAVVAVINFLVPVQWFWVLYLIQLSNISGAAGDFYVTVKFSRFPKDILVRDSGSSMWVYAQASEKSA